MIIWWAVVFLAVFLIGVTKSGFGSGVGLMIVPMMAIALGHIPHLGSGAALGLMLPLLIAGDLLAVWQYFPLLSPKEFAPVTIDSVQGDAVGTLPPHLQVRLVLTRLLPGTLVGLVIGGVLLWLLHRKAELVDALICIEIGLESILLVSLHWWRMYRGVQQHLMPEPWRSRLTGGFVAISSTLAHAAGPIVSMYLLPLRLDRQMYVGACAIYFFMVNTGKLPVYALTGRFAQASVGFTLRFLPLVILGALFGKWINKRMSDRIFTSVVYFVTFLLGWYILGDGVMRLWH